MQRSSFQRGLDFFFPFGLFKMGNIVTTSLEKVKKCPSLMTNTSLSKNLEDKALKISLSS